MRPKLKKKHFYYFLFWLICKSIFNGFLTVYHFCNEYIFPTQDLLTKFKKPYIKSDGKIKHYISWSFFWLTRIFRVFDYFLWLPGPLCPARGGAREGQPGQRGGRQSQGRLPSVVLWTKFRHGSSAGCDWNSRPHGLPHLQGVRQDQQHSEYLQCKM